jgi:hypothetical protein
MVVIYLRADCSIRWICRIIILPIDIHKAVLRSVFKRLIKPKPITYFEVNGTAFSFVALPRKKVAGFEIVSILRSSAICRSIGIAWTTAVFTSGMVIADAAWLIANVALELEDGWKSLYP